MSSLLLTDRRSPARQYARVTAAAVASLAATAGAFLYAPNSSHAAEPAAPPAPKVTVAPVEEKLVTEYEELIGRVDATETVELRARVSGHLNQVKFQAGQIVQKGDILFVIDPRPYQAQHDAAKASAEQARARAEVAEREARRAEQLLATRALSAEEAEARRARADEARAAAAAADAAHAAAKLDLEYTQVRAPITGRVARAFVTTGNLVSGAPASATLLTTIVSVGEVYVYADADESTVLRFARLQREGRIADKDGRVRVAMQLSDEKGFPRTGYIESTDNHLNSNTGSLVVRMVFPDTDGALLPGLFARVRIPVSAPQKALLISERAIGTDQSQKFVLTVTPDKKVAYRTVKLGPTIQGKRVIRDGLHSGDQVVVNGLTRVRPGMTVAPETAVAVTPPSGPDEIASY